LKEEITLNKNVKIDVYFKSLNESIKIIQQNTDAEINIESYAISSSDDDKIDNACAFVTPSDEKKIIQNIYISEFNTVNNETIVRDADQILPNNPAEWPLNNYTRDYVAMYSYKQNKNTDFSKSNDSTRIRFEYLIKIFLIGSLQMKKFSHDHGWSILTNQDVFFVICRLFQEAVQHLVFSI